MKDCEKGFTLIELVVALAIIPLIGIASTMTVFQVLKFTERSNSRMTVVTQVQNAGYWISGDAQAAERVVVDNLEPDVFLILTWTEREYGDDSTYHSVTYLFEQLSDGIGRLKRVHWSSTGANEETLVAEHIYYDPADPVDTSSVSYQAPLLITKLTSRFGDAIETREYRTSRRQNFD